MTQTNHPAAAVIEFGPAFALKMGIIRRLVEAAPVALQKNLRQQIAVGFVDPHLVQVDLFAGIDFVVAIDFRGFELRIRPVSFLLPAADYLPLGRRVPDSLVVHQR